MNIGKIDADYSLILRIGENAFVTIISVCVFHASAIPLAAAPQKCQA
jgi:hypothetical protein